MLEDLYLTIIMGRGEPVALGFRARSGWAAMVVASTVAVVERRHINLAGSGPPHTVQPYHAARGLGLSDAEKAIERAASRARQLAANAIREALSEHNIVGCGVGHDPNQKRPPLAKILASHPLLHTAEGLLFRTAIADAAAECGLTVVAVPERDLPVQPALERPQGAPWRQDEKLATAAALIALAVACGR
jgi:predicted NBD/HSP70 family sugar kinase